MAQFASDSFTGSAGTVLSTYSANWVRHGSYASGEMVLSDADRVRRSNSNAALYYNTGTPASADYSVSADIFTKTTSAGESFPSVAGRINTAANTFYMARYAGGTDDGWQLFKLVSGVATQLGSTSTQTLTDETAYNVKLEMVGTAIKLFKELSGSATISATDSAITAAGVSGLRMSGGTAETNTTGGHLDNFSADDVGGAPTGTASVSNTADVSTAVGTTTLTGSVAQSNQADTSAGAGTTTPTGTLARSNLDDTSSAAGSSGSVVTGTAAVTNTNDSGVASGAFPLVGSLARSNISDTSTASGTTTPTGTVARSNASDTALASGAAGAITGTASVSEQRDTLSASGSASGGIIPSNPGGGGGGRVRETITLKKPREVKTAHEQLQEILAKVTLKSDEKAPSPVPKPAPKAKPVVVVKKTPLSRPVVRELPLISGLAAVLPSPEPADDEAEMQALLHYFY